MDKQVTNNNTLYQVYDVKSCQVAGPIILARRDPAAIRLFFDMLGNQHSTLHQHPEDYELRVVGIQDEDTAKIEGCLPYTIATGTAWVEAQRPRAQQLQLAQEA